MMSDISQDLVHYFPSIEYPASVSKNHMASNAFACINEDSCKCNTDMHLWSTYEDWEFEFPANCLEEIEQPLYNLYN